MVLSACPNIVDYAKGGIAHWARSASRRGRDPGNGDSVTKGPQAIRDFARALRGDVGNMPPLPGVFPDYFVPIVRSALEGRELVMARWGMPSPFGVLKGKNRDPGVTNICPPTTGRAKAPIRPAAVSAKASFVSLQLSLSVETPPSGSQWVHEIKLDGYRIAARIDNDRTQLLTRTGLDWTGKYPSIAEALANLNVKTAWSDREHEARSRHGE
jgi:hypothetical protein